MNATEQAERTSETESRRVAGGALSALVGGLITLLGVGAATLFLLGGLGRWWWVAELCSHFRPHYALVLGLTGAALLFWRRWRSSAFLLLTGLIAALPVLALYREGDGAPPGVPTVRLLSANVLTSNRDTGRLLAQIKAEDPGLLVLLEINERWRSELTSLEATYPHRLLKPREDNFGIAVFSRLPGTALELEQLGETRLPSIVATFEWQGEPMTLIATHPLPPLGSSGARRRNRQLEAIAERAAATAGAVIVIGDLNITPWSPHFRDLLQQGELRNSAQGHGPQPTWPAGSRLMRIPIDHCLHSAELVTVDRRVGSDIGSDHLPIVVDLALRGEPPPAAEGGPRQ
jgi:endonuclease/exonuclease/phosphatase (EEP) superfamily protein YafD